MSNEDFVEMYIDQCLDQGIVKPDNICNKAIERIKQIDNKLEEYAILRTERNNLLQVLRNFNHEEAKSRGRRARAPMINSDIANVESNPSYIEGLVEICNIVEKFNSPISMRELMSKTKYDTEDPTPLYTMVKYLFNSGILTRNEDRYLKPGSNWDNRPKATSND